MGCDGSWQFSSPGFETASAVHAQTETVNVSIGRFVEFVDADTVEASITVTCAPGEEVLEAFAYVLRRDHNSDSGFFNPLRRDPAYVLGHDSGAEGETFRRGRVSAFVLLGVGRIRVAVARGVTR
jgi:hypothetical protein